MRWIEQRAIQVGTRVASGATAHALRLFGVSDAVIAAYLGLMWLIVASSGRSAALARSAQLLEISMAVLVAACFLGRARSALPAIACVVAYRTTIVGVILGSYLMLRDLLPAVRPDELDAALLDIDVRLCGVEPTLWLEPFTTPPVVEYFAFFYFSYFAICVMFTVAVIGLNAAPEATSEFAIGSALVCCVGQLGYVAVPAYGPVHHLEGHFHAPLKGGLFFRWVLETVAAGGAMKDVFPSLHTAAPVWFALFAVRRARGAQSRLWMVAAIVATFFAANITVSTVVLRWHYLIDVIAGLALAAGAAWSAPRLADWEHRIRTRHGLGPAWTVR